MADCVLCGHQLREHHGNGCHHHGSGRGHCACDYVQQPPLPPAADAAEHRARSDWWDRQARTSWALATRAREDLERWYELMSFHRVARRAELDHRLYAESLTRPRPLGPQQPGPEPVPDARLLPDELSVPVEPAQPVLSLAQRVELARIV